jgi:hypothetical protein
VNPFTKKRRTWWQRSLVGLAALLAIVLVIRIVLDPIAAHFTRKALSRMKGFRGDFESVHVTVFGPGYTIRRLKIIEDPRGSWNAPIFYAESAHVGLDVRSLMRGKLVAHARLVEPKIEIINDKPPSKKPPAATKPAPDLSAQLGEVTPLEVSRVEIVGGELLFRDDTAAARPEVWVHRLEVAAENLPTRRSLSSGRPTTLAASGVVGKTGQMRLFASADPFAHPLAFTGRFELRGLHMDELYAFIAPKTKLHTPKGTLDLYAEFVSKGGRLEGGVKPVLKNVEVKSAEGGVLRRIEASVADAAVKLASDRVPDRDAVVTIVPLEGRLMNPDAQVWPAVLGVARNAFVQGISAGFAHLPPEKAAAPKSALGQLKEALDEDEGPPKAQPSAKGGPQPVTGSSATRAAPSAPSSSTRR